MTDSGSIDDIESLRTALREVLDEAHTNGVDIEGSVTIRATADQNPDWEVQIWEIEQ